MPIHWPADLELHSTIRLLILYFESAGLDFVRATQYAAMADLFVFARLNDTIRLSEAKKVFTSRFWCYQRLTCDRGIHCQTWRIAAQLHVPFEQ